MGKKKKNKIVEEKQVTEAKEEIKEAKVKVEKPKAKKAVIKKIDKQVEEVFIKKRKIERLPDYLL